jgi:hypothetical protein
MSLEGVLDRDQPYADQRSGYVHVAWFAEMNMVETYTQSDGIQHKQIGGLRVNGGRKLHISGG